jgi:holo-[acyl-carrier protein] synthase
LIIKGFGVDIIEIDRIERVIGRYPRFLDRLFTLREKSYCLKRPRPASHFALRFAAKEAVAKALGTGVNGFSFKDIEVEREKNGKPRVKLTGKAREIAEKMGVEEIYLSLSFTRQNAVASCIALARSEENGKASLRAEFESPSL